MIHFGALSTGVDQSQCRTQPSPEWKPVKASIQVQGNADAMYNPPWLNKYNFAIILLLL